MDENLAGAIGIFGGGLIVLMYFFPEVRGLLNIFTLTMYGTVGITLYAFSK